ncbi:MAG TPA: hypothetical protein VH353_16775 [Caulobacteraceae bacterium]|jgi:hypothetical protein|nr:hypothetical protein [Caulobacteraceae bacterium]
MGRNTKSLAAGLAALIGAGGAFADPPQATTRLGQAFVDVGVKDCIGAVDRWVKVIEPHDEAYAFITVYSKDAPNGGVAAATLTETLSDGQMVVSLQAAPKGSGKCDVSYAMVYAQPERGCAEIRDDFKDWTFIEGLGAVAVLQSRNGPGEELILSPLTNGGCQVVKRLIAYDQ